MNIGTVLYFLPLTFAAGSLVMEHPGSSPSPIQGRPLLYGTVHGAIGMPPHFFQSHTSIEWERGMIVGLQFGM